MHLYHSGRAFRETEMLAITLFLQGYYHKWRDEAGARGGDFLYWDSLDVGRLLIISCLCKLAAKYYLCVYSQFQSAPCPIAAVQTPLMVSCGA
jgi:hypothetical protein